MLKNWRKGLCIIMAVVIGVVTIQYMAPTAEVQAASWTGTYEEDYSGDDWYSYRAVVIKKITKKKVVFQICYASHPGKTAVTYKVVGKRQGNKVTFKYKEQGWGGTGKGTMKLYNNYIKIKTKQTGGTGFSATGGKWKKINKTSENTKFNIW